MLKTLRARCAAFALTAATYASKFAPLLLTCVAFVLGSTAFAQDGGTAGPIDASPAFPLNDVAASTSELIQNAHMGKTIAVILGVLFIISKLALWGGKKLPGAVGAWFSAPLATWVIPQAITFIGGAITVFETPGAKFDLNTIIGMAVVGLAGGGHGAVAAANAQGDAAAATITTKQDAIAAVMKSTDKGPQA